MTSTTVAKRLGERMREFTAENPKADQIKAVIAKLEKGGSQSLTEEEIEFLGRDLNQAEIRTIRELAAIHRLQEILQ